MVRPFLVATILCLSVGCTSLQHGTQSMWSALRPTSTPGPGDKKGDPWVQSAGSMARTELPREEVNDPLKLRNVFMSETARDIERNLGVGD
ncbi:MAG: hypothetical protein KDA58_00720 [Planctomycetaceae bacterium]|nr:hypothetical protein [Planctomycetaceae bacterium]